MFKKSIFLENVVEVEDDVETLDDYETSYNDESGSPNFETTPVDKSKKITFDGFVSKLL